MTRPRRVAMGPGDQLPREALANPDTVRIWLLGGFRLSVGRRTIEEDEWPLKKAASLVKMLALTPGHRMHREMLMELLWPDLAPRAAANNLHRTVHAARRVLEPTPVTASRYLHQRAEQLVLCPRSPLWVDVEAFGSAAARARRSREPAAYRAALELYAGELLPEDRYEDWTESRREELRIAYLALLIELAGLCEERGSIVPAIEALQRVVNHEPTYEEAYVGLMRLYALNEQRHQALRQYEQLRKVLRKKLDTRPGAVSRRLYEEIRAGRSLPAHSPPPVSRLPIKPPGTRQHNLPNPQSSFIGREHEMLEVKRLLAMTRLLTLAGTGGCGKTRLALEIARDLVGAYPDGVWLVELASLSDPALVPQAVARALGIREQPGRPLTATLVDALRSKQMLLVLDNCEHLVDACAPLVDTLLSACSHLRVLATSREALGVIGEASWPVSSLAVPDAGPLPAIESLTQYEAVQLFVERARSRLPAFVLTMQNARAVVDVCRKLDGIPLAIELATARVTTLAVEQVVTRLNDSLGLLTGGGRTAPPRQQTLRATLDWSYELLSELERKLFRRLSVFAGGWTLEAAEAIGDGAGIEQGDILDLMNRLVNKSLVVAGALSGEESALRYRMLEPVRQYGRELLEGGGEAEQVRERHAGYYLALAEKVEPKINGADRGLWLNRLEVEHDNLRAALRWASDTGEAGTGLRLGGALFWFWLHRGYWSEGRGWLEGALAGASVRPAVRAKALCGAGALAWAQGEHAVARPHLEESVALWRELGDKQGLAHALHFLSMELLGRAAPAVARPLCEESVALFREVKEKFGLALSLATLGILALTQEDPAARSFLEESVAIGRTIGDNWILGLPLRNLGIVALREGDYDRAVALLKESLSVLREVGEKWFISRSVETLAEVVCVQGDYGRAARLFGAAEALREEVGALVLPVFRAGYDRGVAAARSGLDEESFSAAWAEGRAMTLEQTLEYALGTWEPPAAPVPHDVRGGKSPDKLTRREREVALLLARGLTNRQVAAELVLSERTVENHVSRILGKLGFHSRAQIAVWVAEQRLLPADPG